MSGDHKFLNMLKSTRIKRILPLLILILIPAAKTNQLTPELFLLGLNIILIYGASSIYNAHKDNDYDLPTYFPIAILIPIALAILIATSSTIILIASLLWVSLGFLYNTAARYVVLGDGMVLGFTHLLIPITAASILLNINPQTTIAISSSIYFIGISIMPSTNLKDIAADKKRKYKTLVNSTKNPEIVASAFLLFSIPIFAIIYLLLCENLFCLISLIPTALIGITTSAFMLNKKFKKAMNLMRVYLISAYIFLIINLTLNPTIIILSFTIAYLYILILITE